MLSDISSDLFLYNSPYLTRRKKTKRVIPVNWHIKKVLASNAQNILLRGGYGAGKSKFLALKAASLLQRDRVNILFMTLTHGYIVKILIPYCAWALDLIELPHEINLQNKYILVYGYGYIYFFSYSDPATLVSLNVGHILLDEFDEQPKKKAQLVFEQSSARKRLKISKNRVAQTIIATTPRAIGSFCYDLFEVQNADNPNFTQFEIPTFANWKNLRESYVQEQLAILPENRILSHIYGKWAPLTANADLVYYCFSEENLINHTNPNYPKSFEQLLVGMDFNVGKMAAVVSVEVKKNNTRNIIVVNELVGLKNTENMIKQLKTEYPNSFLTVYPDYSGGSRNTVVNDTDVSLLKASGIRVITKPNPLIKNRVNVVNSAFKNALGQRMTLINREKCPKLITALTSQGYTQSGEPDKSQGHDHVLDALGYLIYNRVGKTQIRGYQ
jgi:hypothetical protein